MSGEKKSPIGCTQSLSEFRVPKRKRTPQQWGVPFCRAAPLKVGGEALGTFWLRCLAENETDVHHVAILQLVPMLDNVLVRDRHGAATPRIGINPRLATISH